MELIKKSNMLETKFEPNDEYKKICSKFSVDWMELDWEQDIMPNQKDFSKEEFKVYVIEKIKELSPLKQDEIAVIDMNKSEYDSIKEQRDMIEQEEKERAEQELIKEFKKPSGKVLSSPQIYQMQERMKMVIKGFHNACFIVSPAGLGKTFSAVSLCQKEKIEFEYISCKATPLEMYSLLYSKKDTDIIILDDMDDAFVSSSIIINMLKGACYKMGSGKKRVIQYNSTKLPKELPSLFEIKARFIILSNKIPKNPLMSSLISRTLFFELRMSYKEKISVLEQYSKMPYDKLTPKERQTIFEYLKENSSEATELLNFRVFERLCSYYTYSKEKWKKLAEIDLKVDFDRSVVLNLIKSKMPLSEKIKEFKEKTKKCGRTFYRIREEIHSA